MEEGHGARSRREELRNPCTRTYLGEVKKGKEAKHKAQKADTENEEDPHTGYTKEKWRRGEKTKKKKNTKCADGNRQASPQCTHTHKRTHAARLGTHVGRESSVATPGGRGAGDTQH